MHFDENPFKCQCKKRRDKGLRISCFALLLVVFKWHHGSEGVTLGNLKTIAISYSTACDASQTVNNVKNRLGVRQLPRNEHHVRERCRSWTNRPDRASPPYCTSRDWEWWANLFLVLVQLSTGWSVMITTQEKTPWKQIRETGDAQCRLGKLMF